MVAEPTELDTGESVRLRGRVRPRPGAPPAHGRPVAIQYLERATGRWRPALVVRTDAKGRFDTKYRFRYVTGLAEIRLRATAPAEGGWPFARGSSVPVTVRSTVVRLRTMSKATLQTNAGPITVEFFDEDAPKTVENFRKLAADGFYDGLIFHRVIPDFMVQGGCPQGTGTGGPGYTFEDEFNDHKVVRGALAMANAGPNTNGSQFFIVTTGAAPWLDGKHTVFGEIVDGMDVVDKIEASETDARDKPLEEKKIEKVELAD